MQTKVKKIIITVIAICAIGIPLGMRIYNKSAVEFKDENMKKVMVYASTNEHGGNEASHEKLSEIKHLRLGYVGYYNTLEDIRWAKNTEQIEINMPESRGEAYEISQGKVPEEVSEEKVKQYEKELGEVLPKFKKLKKLSIISDFGCEWDSIDFLKDCDQIEDLSLARFKIKDFSVLKQCKSLKRVSLYKAPIEKAEDLDLTGLEKLKCISILDTPLAENLEEVKKLKEAYPDVDIEY